LRRRLTGRRLRGFLRRWLCGRWFGARLSRRRFGRRPRLSFRCSSAPSPSAHAFGCNDGSCTYQAGDARLTNIFKRCFASKIVLEHRFSGRDCRLQKNLLEDGEWHTECGGRGPRRDAATFQGGTERLVLLHPRFQILAKAWAIVGDKLCETGASHHAQRPAAGRDGAGGRWHAAAYHIAGPRNSLFDRARQGFGGFDFLYRRNRHWIRMLARWQTA
jgi:hypothetical protein